MALLEIHGVSKGFDQNGQPKSRASRAVGSTPDLIRGLPVLANINLAINENEFVCSVGRSGAGNTTLISLIAGLLQPDEGQILLEGKLIDGPGPDRGMIIDGREMVGVGSCCRISVSRTAVLVNGERQCSVVSHCARSVSHQQQLKACAVRMRKVLKIPAGDY
jgi:ABC-type cobalamin/Fe3+-siderophores transport system ATPase subunit